MRHYFRGGITNHQFVKPEKREYARAQRRSGTPSEQLAWELLRGRRMLGLKFRRQQVIDGYIVDFYCAEHPLVIEIDGGVHLDPEVVEFDRAREVALRNRSQRIIRISNEALSYDLLTGRISAELNEKSPPLPKREGAGG